MTLGWVHSLICFLTGNYFISDLLPPFFLVKFQKSEILCGSLYHFNGEVSFSKVECGGGLVAPSCLTLL